MIENISYSEKLKHPLWQKKRLEIMQRDEFSCIGCNDDKSKLNVHHKHYKSNTEIWDYDNGNFITLCDKCHLLIHELHDRMNIMLNKFRIEDYEDLIEILYYLSSLGMENFNSMKQIIKYAHNLVPDEKDIDTDDLEF